MSSTLQKPSIFLDHQLNVDEKATSWLQYYRDRIKAVEKTVDVRQMYIYVSPKNFSEEGKVYDTLEAYIVHFHSQMIFSFSQADWCQ